MKQDIIQACLLIQPSKEEIAMLHNEIENTLTFYQQKIKSIDAKILKLAQAKLTTDFTRGSIALLHHLKLKVGDSSCTDSESEYSDNEDD